MADGRRPTPSKPSSQHYSHSAPSGFTFVPQVYHSMLSHYLHSLEIQFSDYINYDYITSSHTVLLHLIFTHPVKANHCLWIIFTLLYV